MTQQQLLKEPITCMCNIPNYRKYTNNKTVLTLPAYLPVPTALPDRVALPAPTDPTTQLDQEAVTAQKYPEWLLHCMHDY